MPHLDPPEKGRKAWLCVSEPGAKREGSNTCRESTRVRTGRVKPLLPIHEGTGLPEVEARGGVGSKRRDQPILPPIAIIPLGWATPSDCGEGHKRKVRL